MFESSNNFGRSDSFSTVDSSVAVADVMRQYADLSRPVQRQPVPVIPASTPANMKFEKSENINVIYNNYYNNPSPERKSSQTNSFASFLSEHRRTIVISNFIKFLKTKKGARIAFGLFVVVLSVIASVISYYVIRSNGNNNSDATTSLGTTIETTTTELTTTSSLTASSTTTITDPTTEPTPIITDPITDEPTPDTTTSATEKPVTELTTTDLTSGLPNEPTTTEEITTTPITTTSISTTSIITTPTTSKPLTTTTVPNPFPDFYMTRDDWGAEQPRSKNISKLQTPIKKIIVGHTGGSFCNNVNACIAAVKSIQNQDFSLEDIAYNFLIGVDGKVYEGRGFNYQGQHTKNLGATDYNSIGIMIAFIGNYKSTSPSVDQIILLENFIKFFQQSGNISSAHLILSQDDLTYRDVTADALNGAVANLKNYEALYKVHRREEWGALIPKPLPKFSRVMNWIIIGHITGQGCSDLAECIKEVKKVETENLKSGYNDTVYNFLLGGKGLIFEGRGWDIIGQTTLLPNSAISVIVLGDYRFFSPAPEVEESLKQIFNDGLLLGKLTNDFKVFGRSDFGGAGPGALLMNQIKKWDRYGNKTTY